MADSNLNTIKKIRTTAGDHLIDATFLGGYTFDDVGDYVNILMSLEGTKIAYLIKEKGKNTYSVSLRSLKGYDVSKIAQKFGGGGHIQASGFCFGGKLKDFEKQLLFECQKEAKGEKFADVW